MALKKTQRYLWFVLVGMFFALSLPIIACADTTITDSGSLLDSANKPVADAIVELVGNPAVNTTTAVDGSFTLAGVPSGSTFSLKMSKAGYQPVYTANSNSTANIVSSGAYTIYTTAEINNWGWTSGTGIIRTRVADAANKTTGYLDGVSLSAVSQLHPDKPYQILYYNGTTYTGNATATDTSGRYMILNLSDGDTVKVTGIKSGFDPNQKSYLVHDGGVSEGKLYLDVTTGAPVLAHAPATIDFGSVTVGKTSSNTTLTFTNTGTAKLLVSSVAMTGDTALFSCTTSVSAPCPQLPSLFAPGESCAVDCNFAPSASGKKTATMTLNSNDPASPATSVVLSGTGVIKYTIGTSVVGGNGTINCDSPVEQGATSVCSIVPANGYVLASLTDNSASVISSVKNNSYTITAVTGDHSVVGSFEKSPEFSLTVTSPTVVTARSNGTKGTITFTFTGTATSESILSFIKKADWITIGAIKLKGSNGTIAYTAAANDGATRTGAITIGAATLVTINQSAPYCKITAATASAVPAAGGDVTINVTVDHDFCTWSVTAIKAGGETWLTDILNVTKTGSGTVTGKATPNTTNKAKSTVVTIATGDGKAKKTAVVKQAAK